MDAARPKQRRPDGSSSGCSTAAALGRRAGTTVYHPVGFTDRAGHPVPTADRARRRRLPPLRLGSRRCSTTSSTDGDLPPIVAAFSDPDERLVEYADDPRHHRLPDRRARSARSRHEFPLAANPAGALRDGVELRRRCRRSRPPTPLPGFFGRLLLQSGSFAGAGAGCRSRPERLWHPVREFVQPFLAEPAPVAERVFVTCGAYESLICENRGFVSVLAATGMNVRFVENLDGHTWVGWRDGLGEALRLSAVQGATGDVTGDVASARGRHHSPHRTLTRRRSLLADLLRGGAEAPRPVADDRSQHRPLRGRSGDDRTVRPAPGNELRPRRRSPDALVHDEPGVDQEGRDHGRSLRVQQSVDDPVDGEAHVVLRHDPVGHADPGDVDRATEELRAEAATWR